MMKVPSPAMASLCGGFGGAFVKIAYFARANDNAYKAATMSNPPYAFGPGPRKPRNPESRPDATPSTALSQKTWSRGFKEEFTLELCLV